MSRANAYFIGGTSTLATMRPPPVISRRHLFLGAAASRLAVLLCGYLAVAAVGYELKPFQYRLSHNELWNLPARWDAGWYLGIARRGYDWQPELVDRQQAIAFFPAFPLTMRLVGEALTVPAHVLDEPGFLGNGNTRVTWGGVVVAATTFSLALVRLHRLVASVTGDAALAGRTVLLLASWPFALFFSAPYAEGLFLLAGVSASWEARQSRGGRCFLWGLVAGLTRSNGWALAPALVMLALSGRTPGHRIRKVASALGPLTGTALFSAYVWTLSGHPLAWLHAQAGWGRELHPIAFVTRRAMDVQQHGVWGYLAADPVDAIAVMCVVMALAAAFVAGRRFGWSFAMFPVAYLLPALLIDLPAIGRMTCVLFPSFLGAGLLLTNRQAVALGVVFAALQLWLAARFFTWQTPY